MCLFPKSSPINLVSIIYFLFVCLGPVKIFVSDKKSADIYGVVTINFELSRNDATCSCAVNLQDIYKC